MFCLYKHDVYGSFLSYTDPDISTSHFETAVEKKVRLCGLWGYLCDLYVMSEGFALLFPPVWEVMLSR